MRATDVSLWMHDVACVWSMCIGVGRCQSHLHWSSTHRSHQVQSHPSQTGSLSAFPALASPLHESPPPLRLLGQSSSCGRRWYGGGAAIATTPKRESLPSLHVLHQHQSVLALCAHGWRPKSTPVVDRSTPGRHDRPPPTCIDIVLWAFPDRCRTGRESLKRAGANRSAPQCFDVLGKRRVLSRFEIKQFFRWGKRSLSDLHGGSLLRKIDRTRVLVFCWSWPPCLLAVCRPHLSHFPSRQTWLHWPALCM